MILALSRIQKRDIWDHVILCLQKKPLSNIPSLLDKTLRSFISSKWKSPSPKLKGALHPFLEGWSGVLRGKFVSEHSVNHPSESWKANRFICKKQRKDPEATKPQRQRVKIISRKVINRIMSKGSCGGIQPSLENKFYFQITVTLRVNSNSTP